MKKAETLQFIAISFEHKTIFSIQKALKYLEAQTHPIVMACRVCRDNPIFSPRFNGLHLEEDPKEEGKRDDFFLSHKPK